MSIKDLGTVRPGSTIYIEFDSFGANGESLTLTGLAASDVECYKNGGTTQRASDNGYTLLDTDGIDFDGITGIHGLSIDLADNSTAGFWEAGAHYRVVISSVTINSQTVSFTAATFRIGYASAVLNTSIASLSSQTSFTLTAGPAEDDALNGMWAVIHDVASAVQWSRVLILDYTGSTKTVTLAAGATFTAAASDNFAVIDMAPLQPTTTGRLLDVSSGGEAGLDWANIGSPTTSVNLSGTSTKALEPTTAGRTLDVTTTGEAGIDWANIGSPTTTVNLSGTTIKTATDIATAVDAVDNFVDTEISSIITELAKVPKSDSTVTFNATALGSIATAVAGDALFTGIDSTLSNVYSDTQAMLVRLQGLVRHEGQIGDTGNDSTHIHMPNLSFGDDEINGSYLAIKDVTNGEVHVVEITDWVNATKLATVPTLPFTPQDETDYYWLLSNQAAAGGSAPTASQVADAVWAEALPGSYTSGQAGYILGTNLNATISSRATQTSVDAVDDYIDTELAALTTELAKVPKSDSNVTWNATAAAQLQSEANDALVANGLDHLLAASVTGTDVTDNSIIAKLVSKSATADWDSFANTTDALEALRDRGDAAWGTATGFSTHSASDVWAVATRVLTAGTNIALAKGTGVTGFNDLDAAGVRSAVGLASANLDTQLSNLATAIDTVDNFIDTEIAAITSAIGTPSNLGSGATLSANLADIEAQTDDIGVAGAGLTAADDAILTALSTVSTNVNTTNSRLGSWTGTGSNNVLGALQAIARADVTAPSDLNSGGGGYTASLMSLEASVTTWLTNLQDSATAILADTNELQTDWANGGRLDLILDARASQTSVDAIDDLLDTEFPALTSTVGSLWTTAITESYGADGAAVTPAQALYEIMQQLGERSISGTTATVKKRDGSTTAFTQTLNDAVTPTAITRA